MADRPGFWIVVKDTDTRSHRHYTREAAETEAKRLARENPDHGFHVLEPVSTAKREAPIILTRHDVKNDDDIPF